MVNKKVFIAASDRIHAKQLKVFVSESNCVLSQVQDIQVLQVFTVWWKIVQQLTHALKY